MSKVLFTTASGDSFWVSQVQADTLNALSECQRGGCATVHGYIPSTGYIKNPVVNINMITRFSTAALYERKMRALAEIRYSDVSGKVPSDPVLSAMSENDLIALFETRKAMLVESLNKTLSGDRNDSHRQGHDRCYAKVSDGVKVNYVTEKVDGLQQPVLTDGYPTAQAIMVAYLELSREYVQKGERKVVNSGAPVRMGNLIEDCLNQRSVGYRTLSLKEGNFDSLRISRKTFLPEDFAAFGEDVLNG